jgi:serine/threonine protein kinase
MTAFPDFAAHGYQVIKELGHNLEGGRFTYLAKRLADHVDVVIKQFQFSKGSGWDGFRAIEREIQSLQGLNHRGIPKYLDKFETDSGYCLVTEYFPADTLAVGRSFTPDQIKQITVQLLEILVYLQERMPPVIHRDVKPENILVDDNLNVYLIDFGFARVGSGSVAMSSAAAGTFGFMAPEQIRNLKLTNASDLYGLGLTLICLIGAIRSTDIGNYIDFSNQLDRSKIDPKLKGCSLTFVKWLDQMVAPDPGKRFADATIALEALKPLYVVRIPEVKFFKDGKEFDPSKDVLEFKATKLGEKLTQTITIVNPIPETFLEGRLQVAPHRNDPAHTPDNHSWISLDKRKFEGNSIHCKITVDTNKLRSNAEGTREVLVFANSSLGSHSISIKVKTPPKSTYPLLKINWTTLLLILSFLIPVSFECILNIVLPIVVASWNWPSMCMANECLGRILWNILISFGIMIFVYAIVLIIIVLFYMALYGIIITTIVIPFWLLFKVFSIVTDDIALQDYWKFPYTLLPSETAVLGILLGSFYIQPLKKIFSFIPFQDNNFNWVSAILKGTDTKQIILIGIFLLGIPFIGTIALRPIKKFVENSRNEEHLIKP